MVKFKLKKARDTIQNFVDRKQKDLSKLDEQIKEATPEYQQTKNKRKIVPLLQAKKSLNQIIDSGETRLKLVKNKLDEVEMQQLNAEVSATQHRPSMCSMTQMPTPGKFRRSSRPKIGKAYWLRPRKGVKSTGPNKTTSKTTVIFNRCGRSSVGASWRERRSLSRRRCT